MEQSSEHRDLSLSSGWKTDSNMWWNLETCPWCEISGFVLLTDQSNPENTIFCMDYCLTTEPTIIKQLPLQKSIFLFSRLIGYWYCRTNHPIFSVWCQTMWMENLKNGSDKGLNHLKYTLHYQYSNYIQSSKFINYSDDIAFSNQHKKLTEQKLLSLISTIFKCILEPESWSF